MKVVGESQESGLCHLQSLHITETNMGFIQVSKSFWRKTLILFLSAHWILGFSLNEFDHLDKSHPSTCESLSLWKVKNHHIQELLKACSEQ